MPLEAERLISVDPLEQERLRRYVDFLPHCSDFYFNTEQAIRSFDVPSGEYFRTPLEFVIKIWRLRRVENVILELDDGVSFGAVTGELSMPDYRDVVDRALANSRQVLSEAYELPQWTQNRTTFLKAVLEIVLQYHREFEPILEPYWEEIRDVEARGLHPRALPDPPSFRGNDLDWSNGVLVDLAIVLEELLATDPGDYPLRHLCEQRWAYSLQGLYLPPKWDRGRLGTHGSDNVHILH